MKKYTLLAISIAFSLTSIFLKVSPELVVISWIWILIEIRRLFKASKIAVTVSSIMLITAMPNYSGYIVILIFYIINVISIIQRRIKNKPFPKITTTLVILTIIPHQGSAILLICYLWNMMEMKKYFTDAK